MRAEAQVEQLKRLEEDLATLLKQLKAQHRAVAAIHKAVDRGDGKQLLASLPAVDEALLERLGLAEPAGAAVAAARRQLDELRQQQRSSLMRELQQAAETAGRGLRRLGDSPPELLISPCTVLVDLEQLEAVVSYARQELVRVPAQCTAIMNAVERQEKALRKPQPSCELLFDQLRAAYVSILGRSGQPFGARVELSEVLPQLALLLQPARFLADPVSERFTSYSKAHLLYGLARLRESRMLERDGYRLDLGTATGDSVRNRARVFFLQDAHGQGQYYLSLRFIRR